MQLPPILNFEGIEKEQVYYSDSNQYKQLNSIPDNEWNEYVNKMLSKGISVTYDAELDCFTVKPQKLKVQESLMTNKKVRKDFYSDSEIKSISTLIEKAFLKENYARYDTSELEDFIRENQIVEDSIKGKNIVFLFETYKKLNEFHSSDEASEVVEIVKSKLEEAGYFEFSDFEPSDIENFVTSSGITAEKASYLDADTILEMMRHAMDNDYELADEESHFNEAEVNETDLLYDEDEPLEEEKKIKSKGIDDTKDDDGYSNKGKKIEGGNKKIKGNPFDKKVNESINKKKKLKEGFEDEEGEVENDNTDENGEIEGEAEVENMGFDDEANMTDQIDEPDTEEVAVDGAMNSLESSKGISSPSTVTIEDLESLINKILNNRGDNNTSPIQTKPQAPNTEAEAVKATTPALGTGPQANVLETEFSAETSVQADGMSNQAGEVLDTEFPNAQEKIGVVRNKIQNQPSYNDYLEGGATGEDMDLYNYRTDNFEEGSYLEDSDDFTRNAALSGVDDMTGDIESGDNEFVSDEMPGEEVEALPSVSANTPTGGLDSGIAMSEPTMPPMPSPDITNKTVKVGGMPVQIILSGIMLSMGDIGGLAEGIKREGLKLKRIQSINKPNELNILVESSENKQYIINYKDVDKYKNMSPFSIKHEKFQSLTEACKRINNLNKNRRQLKEQKNFRKFNDMELLSRASDTVKEATILSDFKGKTNYMSSWNVKAMGSINLKTGINEAYSNIMKSSTEKNTLIKTKDGQFFLMKGNLKTGGDVGIIKELADLEGKKSYGIGKVIGIYENTAKGMGQIMYKTQRTSLPLLIWK